MESKQEINKEKIKNLHYRMYKNKYPEPNDYVSVIVTESDENGVKVSLIEYDNIEGMLFTKEITKDKKIKNPNLLLPVGKTEILCVLAVDKVKGFIDLSKKNAKINEIEEHKQYFHKSKMVEGIVKLLSLKTDKTMKYLYENIIWPLYEKFDHAYDALKSILEGNEQILEELKIDDEIKDELIKILEIKLAIEPVKIRSIFGLTCFTFKGIDGIKEALLIGEKKRKKEIPFNFYIIGSPLYECSVITAKIKEGIKAIKEALKEVEKSIKDIGGNFYITEEAHVINDKENKNISQQMKDANDKLFEINQKEREIDDDEEEEEDEYLY